MLGFVQRKVCQSPVWVSGSKKRWGVLAMIPRGAGGGGEGGTGRILRWILADSAVESEREALEGRSDLAWALQWRWWREMLAAVVRNSAWLSPRNLRLDGTRPGEMQVGSWGECGAREARLHLQGPCPTCVPLYWFSLCTDTVLYFLSN